jgi:hypothetical protein
VACIVGAAATLRGNACNRNPLRGIDVIYLSIRIHELQCSTPITATSVTPISANRPAATKALPSAKSLSAAVPEPAFARLMLTLGIIAMRSRRSLAVA